eukprot:2627920-Lingulodinium_polyedra.AAC.1
MDEQPPADAEPPGGESDPIGETLVWTDGSQRSMSIVDILPFRLNALERQGTPPTSRNAHDN